MNDGAETKHGALKEYDQSKEEEGINEKEILSNCKVLEQQQEQERNVDRLATQAFWVSQCSSSFFVIEENERNLVNCVGTPTYEVDYEERITPHKRVPIGQDFQANLPTRILTDPELDSLKWLGEHIWPNLEATSVTEKSNTPKAVDGVCSTKSGSIDSVRRHIEESRRALKDELGDAFYKWGFHEMGEIVAERWSEADELLFRCAVQRNPESFWADVYNSFPSKDPRDLVSYYFNVFVLRKRAIQNRLDPNNVDSDDDELWLDSDEQEGSFIDVPEVGDGVNGGNAFMNDYFHGIWDNIDDLSSESGDENLACQYQESATGGLQPEKIDKQQFLSSEGEENKTKTMEGNTVVGRQDPSANKENEIQMLPCIAYSVSEPEASSTFLNNVENVIITKESIENVIVTKESIENVIITRESQQESIPEDSQLPTKCEN